MKERNEANKLTLHFMMAGFAVSKKDGDWGRSSLTGRVEMQTREQFKFLFLVSDNVSQIFWEEYFQRRWMLAEQKNGPRTVLWHYKN